jgi:hypothetical protein
MPSRHPLTVLPLASRPRPGLEIQPSDIHTSDSPADTPPRIPPRTVPIYPSLERAPRERMVSISLRVPLSMQEQLETVCAANHTDQSALVRDFIAAGLLSLNTQ